MLEFDPGNNKRILTLTEKTTISDPEYVFVFVNGLTNKKVACTQTDTSSYKNHHNSFTFSIISGTPNPLVGELNLESGFGKYYVYQTEDASSFDYNGIDSVDLRTLTGLVEQGKYHYQITNETPSHYKDFSGSTKQYGN